MTDEAQVEAQEATLGQKLAAEAIGTGVLVLIGCGAAVTTQADIVATGLAFGIAIVVMVYAFGRVSGGHFNPAVSVGAALSGRLSWKDFGLYSAAQVGGALVGGLILALIVLAGDVGWEFGDPLGSNGFGDHGGVELFGALLIELSLTFVFLTVILGTTDERNDNAPFAPLAIGLSLAAIHFVAIPMTLTSVNPARSIGVAFYSGSDAITQLWLFIVAPLVGGALAGLLYPLLFGRGAAPVAGSFGAPKPAAAFGGYQQQWEPAAGQQWGQQPVQQQTGQHAAAGTEQPIIQDGWQWDPQAQQWIPAQQQAAPQPDPGQPQQQGWGNPDASGERTQIRPPEGQQ
jgi:aquaporin Z